MKVIFAHPLIYRYHTYAGGERRLILLAKALVELGVSVEYVTSHLHGGDEFKFDGISIRTLPVPFNYYKSLVGRESYSFSILLKRYLNRTKFDVLHTPGALFYLLQSSRKPVLLEVYDFELLRDTSAFWMALKRSYYSLNFYYRFYRRSLQLADAIGLESPAQYSDLKRFCPSIDNDRVYSLPICVDIADIENRLSGRTMSRKDIGIGEHDFVIISTNRFTRIKGIDVLVEAFNVLHQEISSTKLILVGAPDSYLAEVKRKVHQFGLENDVIIKPNLSQRELMMYYAISDVYVSPVLLGSVSNSILDAMAVGLPIISTVMPWLVRENVNGHIVPRGDAMAIAEALLEFFDSNDRERMGRNSRRLAKEYDSNAVAKTALGIYGKITQGGDLRKGVP
jgi:glycosyltransferase involved in cell wall biosynthesis